MTNIWSQVQKDTLVSQHYAYFDTGAAATAKTDNRRSKALS